ncbi:unnamed protein product [Adineta ricciae]|uniref:G-protein coupled receptors family 1 profile domain-containing protein n=1 Tax=Adineta ricciae TaxID=249248 RepID=A0A815SAC5_ADIRI|nr:unnamed protein product [Adineta ricciae]CAF1487535.1 unnamed protein product [Adineta ricciae]
MSPTEDYINNLSIQMNRYFSIVIFLFGTIGNLLNICVLSQRIFRSNSCAILFLFSSFANLIAILSGLLSRTFSGWIVDLTNTDRFLCKLRAFILNVARPIAFWLILLAAIDRWLLSNPNAYYRRMNTLKNAKRSMIIITILSIILFAHILYCYEPNLVNAPLKCYGVTVTCRLVTDILFTFGSTLIPIVLMFIFGLMTIRNIQSSRKKVRPTDFPMETNQISIGERQRPSLSKSDYRLVMMLLAQILLLFIFGLPLGVQKLYATITINRPTSQLQTAIDNFAYNFTLLLNFLANGIPFYIYTLFGGEIFRKALLKVFFTIKQKVFHSMLYCH